MCGWFTSEWLTIIIQIRSYVNSTYTNRTLHQFQFLTSTCSHIALTSIHPKVVKAKIWIDWWTQDEPNLPITETWLYIFAEHFVYMSWYYKRMMVTIWYEMNTHEQLSQPVPHSDEPVDELTYISRLHQSAQAVSICTHFFISVFNLIYCFN
jgi:hypothetical protein